MKRCPSICQRRYDKGSILVLKTQCSSSNINLLAYLQYTIVMVKKVDVEISVEITVQCQFLDLCSSKGWGENYSISFDKIRFINWAKIDEQERFLKHLENQYPFDQKNTKNRFSVFCGSNDFDAVVVRNSPQHDLNHIFLKLVVIILHV